MDIVLDPELARCGTDLGGAGPHRRRRPTPALAWPRPPSSRHRARRRAAAGTRVRRRRPAGRRTGTPAGARAQLAREVHGRRRLGRALTAAAVLLVLALIGGIVAVFSQRRADEEHGTAPPRPQRTSRSAGWSPSTPARRPPPRPSPCSSPSRRTAATTPSRSRARSSRRSTPTPRRIGRSSASLADRTAGNSTSTPATTAVSSPAPGSAQPDTMAWSSCTTPRHQPRGLGSTARIPFIGVDVSGDGRYVLAHTAFDVHLFDAASGTAAKLPVPPPGAEDLAAVDRGENSIATALLRPGGEQFLVVTSDGVMTLWDLDGGAPVDATLVDGPPGYIESRRAAATGLVELVEPSGTFRVVQRGRGRDEPRLLGYRSWRSDAHRAAGGPRPADPIDCRLR